MIPQTMFKAFAALSVGERLQPWEYEPQPLKADEIEIRVTMIEIMPLYQINEAIEKVLANKARYRIVLVSDESK